MLLVMEVHIFKIALHEVYISKIALHACLRIQSKDRIIHTFAPEITTHYVSTCIGVAAHFFGVTSWLVSVSTGAFVTTIECSFLSDFSA